MTTKYETEVTLRLSSNMIGNSNDQTSFSHKLILTVRQVTNLCRFLADNSSVNEKLSKTQLSTSKILTQLSKII